MSSSPRAPAGIVAAGVVAVIAGVVAGFLIALSFLVISRSDFSFYGLALTPALRSILYFVWAFFLLCAGFLVLAGIYVVRLRNWARLSLVVVAGGGLLFGGVGLAFVMLTLYATPDDPVVGKPLLFTVLAFTYGIPILVAVWWLWFLTRRAVVAQFDAAARPVEPNPANRLLHHPACPLAIRVVGWYLASFVLLLPLLPFLPPRLLALYFGDRLAGPSALLAHLVMVALFAIPGFGLLLLKRWGYVLAVASQLLFAIQGLGMAFGSSSPSSAGAAYRSWGLPVPDSVFADLRYLSLLGPILPLAVLFLLLFYRRPFYAASRLAGKPVPSGSNPE